MYRQKKQEYEDFNSGDKDPLRGSICNPKSHSCKGFQRLVPVTLVDVAGLGSKDNMKDVEGEINFFLI